MRRYRPPAVRVVAAVLFVAVLFVGLYTLWRGPAPRYEGQVWTHPLTGRAVYTAPNHWWVTWKNDVMPGEEREPSRPGDMPDSIRVRTAGPVALLAVALPDPGATVVAAGVMTPRVKGGSLPPEFELDIGPDLTIGRRLPANPAAPPRPEIMTAAVVTLDPDEYMVDVIVTFKKADGTEVQYGPPVKYVTVVPAK